MTRFFPSFDRSTEFAIGRQRVFSLAGWSPQIQSGFHVTRFTQEPLGRPRCIHVRDCHPLWPAFPCRSVCKWFGNSHVRGPTTPPGKTRSVWALPLSLAATDGINVFFFSCGYLDVSVPHVRSTRPMNSAGSIWELPQMSFLIRKSPDRRLFASFPEHIAGYHVLRRLSMPRHPPCTLSSLITFIDHRHRDFRFQIPNVEL